MDLESQVPIVAGIVVNPVRQAATPSHGGGIGRPASTELKVKVMVSPASAGVEVATSHLQSVEPAVVQSPVAPPGANGPLAL
jgi:hypothetical protein